MYKQFLAGILTLSIVSTSMAQTNAAGYCEAIANNETQHIQMLLKLKNDVEKSFRFRRAANNGLAVVNGVDAGTSAVKAVLTGKVEYVIDAAISAIATYLNMKQAKKEELIGKYRNLTLDSMIEAHKEILKASQSEKSCSGEAYQANIMMLFTDRIELQTAGLAALDKIIKSIEDQKQTGSAITLSVLGLAGLYYAFLRQQPIYIPLKILVGVVSAGLVITGGGVYLYDRMTLVPLLNDFKATREATAKSLAADQAKYNELKAGLKLN